MKSSFLKEISERSHPHASLTLRVEPLHSKMGPLWTVLEIAGCFQEICDVLCLPSSLHTS